MLQIPPRLPRRDPAGRASCWSLRAQACTTHTAEKRRRTCATMTQLTPLAAGLLLGGRVLPHLSVPHGPCSAEPGLKGRLHSTGRTGPPAGRLHSASARPVGPPRARVSSNWGPSSPSAAADPGEQVRAYLPWGDLSRATEDWPFLKLPPRHTLPTARPSRPLAGADKSMRPRQTDRQRGILLASLRQRAPGGDGPRHTAHRAASDESECNDYCTQCRQRITPTSNRRRKITRT